MTTPGEHHNQQRQRRVETALANPVLFGEIYVRPHTDRWDGPMPRVGHEILAFLTRPTMRRGVVRMPPEYMKTTVGSNVYPLWLTTRAAAFDKMAALHGCMFSEEEDLAADNLAVLKWHVEHNEELASDFRGPDGQPILRRHPEQEEWSETSIVLWRQGVSKDPTWQAKGLNSKGWQGRRLSHIIGDDVITPASAYSPAKRKEALRLWDQQITTRLIEEGQAVLLSNFTHHQDLPTTIMRRPGYEHLSRPSSSKPGNPEVPEKDLSKGVLLCPEIWSLERLEKERAEKPNEFNRIHLLDPKSPRGEKLQDSWFTKISDDDTPLAYSKYYLAIDAAPGGETEDLDFVNVTVGALWPDNEHLDIVAMMDFRASTARQMQLIWQMHDVWQRIGRGVIAIGAAKVAIDGYLRGALAAVRKDAASKIQPVSLGGGDKFDRIEALGPYAQTGWLRVRESIWDNLLSDDDDQPEELTLREQWVGFPSIAHDDKLDGIDVLIRLARDFDVISDEEFEIEMETIG